MLAVIALAMIVMAGTPTAADAASLQLTPVVWDGQRMRTDLVLTTAGQALTVVSTDIVYEAAAFATIEAVAGEAAQAAGKQLFFSIVQPGLLRVWAHGLNMNSIPSGTLGTLYFTPSASYPQTGVLLTQTATASTPNSQLVQLDSNSLQLPMTHANLQGRATLDGLAVCARVLANGTGGYSCDGQGNFALPSVPLDANGQITLFVWADGMAQATRTLTANDLATPQAIAMRASGCGTTGGDQGGAPSPLATVNISGTTLVDGSGLPICAAVLANGRAGFSCDGSGGFALTDVPLDSEGKVTLFAWADGFVPHKLIVRPADPNVWYALPMRYECAR